MHEDLKTCLDDSRVDEEELEFEFPEIEEDKKSKKTVSELENSTVVEESKPKTEEVKVEQITEKDVKKSENKLLLILAVVFTSLIVIVTAIVFLLPQLTEAKDVKIPDVSNMSVVEAENELESVGFSVATETKEATSDKIEEGNVVKTSPAAGRTVKEGSTITLYVSIGEGGYILEHDDYQRLILLGDIWLYKQDIKQFSCCRIFGNHFNYHGIKNALCGKIYPDGFTPKRILVIQME